MDISLNVTQAGPTPAASVLRSNQAYLELLAEKTTLDGGIAFCCTQFPDWPDGSQFREVWVESPTEAEQTYAAAEAHFAECGVTCTRWALAEAQNPALVTPVLDAHGWQRRDMQALALTAWPAPGEFPDVRILPARPMRAVFRTCWQQLAAYLPDDQQTASVEAAEERLDDHRMDAFVAQVNRQPAGVCALFQVGDIARIIDFFVLPAYRRRGVASALLDHVVALARRLTMRLVCVEVDADNAPGLTFFKNAGFADGGRIVEFHRPGAVRPDYASW